MLVIVIGLRLRALDQSHLPDVRPPHSSMRARSTTSCPADELQVVLGNRAAGRASA